MYLCNSEDKLNKLIPQFHTERQFMTTKLFSNNKYRQAIIELIRAPTPDFWKECIY